MTGCFVAVGAVSFCDLAENLVCQLPLPLSIYSVPVFPASAATLWYAKVVVTFSLFSSPAVSS